MATQWVGQGPSMLSSAFASQQGRQQGKMNEQKLQENAMNLMLKSYAVEEAGRQNEINIAADQEKLARQRNRLDNISTIIGIDTKTLDVELAKVKSEENGMKLQQTASVLQSAMENPDPQVWQQAIADLSKQGVNVQDLGFNGNYQHDLRIAEYVVGHATLDQKQRQTERIANADFKNKVDIANIHEESAMARQTVADQAAMARLEKQLDTQLKIAGIKAAAQAAKDLGIPPELTKYGAREQQNMADSLKYSMTQAGYATVKGMVSEKEEFQQKADLEKMVVDSTRIMYEYADKFLKAGIQPNMAQLRQLAEQEILGRVDLNGRYHDTEDAELKKQKLAWATRVSKGLEHSQKWDQETKDLWNAQSPEQKWARLSKYWTDLENRVALDSAKYGNTQLQDQMKRVH